MILRKVPLWRRLTVPTVILLVLCISLTGVANTYAAMINQALGIQTSKVVRNTEANSTDTQYYKSSYPDLQAEYQAKAALIRSIAQEGTILLKNENEVLPLSSGKLLLLGEDELIFATSHGGGSMDAVTLAAATPLRDALVYAGLEVVTEPESNADAALVVIGRTAGEGADMPVGGLEITDAEREKINQAKQACSRVIVLLSGDYNVEMADLVSDPEIDAILHLGNAGYRGTYGFADVLTGKASPSGHLVETIAVSSLSSPAMQNFGDYSYAGGSKIMASQAKTYVVYAEGIYQDYKYYETRYEDAVLGQGNAESAAGSLDGDDWKYENEVLYSFGFGLSYTTFQQEIQHVTFDESAHTAVVQVKVTNVGSLTGKDVVQVYGQSPYTAYDRQNKVEKAAVQLLGFEKTGELAPGASQVLDVTIPLQWLASYDYTGAKTYIMEAGDYYFALGNGSHEAVNNILAAKGMEVPGSASLVYRFTQDKDDFETYAVSMYTGESITNSFVDADINDWMDTENQITYLSRSDWSATYPKTVEITASKDMISSLNDKKKYENGTWIDSASRITVRDVAYVDADQNDHVVPVMMLRGLDYDDEHWEEVLDNLTISEISNLIANGRYFINACPSIAFVQSTGSDSPAGLDLPYANSSVDGATGEKTSVGSSYLVSDGFTDAQVDLATLTGSMFPSEPVLAATFNKELAWAEGEMMGEDGIYADTAFLWGPGANLHRTPYGGRASEYYSADSILSTLMGTEQIRGGWSKGQVLVVKHFAVNEQEQNRIGVATFTNEQALRENMLRSFEGIMTYGQAHGLMGSYNRLGLIGTSEEYDLMTTVLRKEWGSNCYVITDLNSPTAGLYDGNAIIAAGATMIMNNGTFDAASGSAVNCTLSVESIKSDPVLLTAARDAVHRTLYTFVNSVAMNGQSTDDIIMTVTPWWQPVLQGLSIGFGVLAALCAVCYLISVNRKKEGK